MEGEPPAVQRVHPEEWQSHSCPLTPHTLWTHSPVCVLIFQTHGHVLQQFVKNGIKILDKEFKNH